MSFPLFKVLVKKSWKLWSIFAAILLIYLLVLIFLFDQMKDSLSNFDIAGMPFYVGSRLDLLAGTYFDMLIFMFPMVFYIILANKLVSKTVDDTSMSSFLSSSISRKKYLITAIIFFVLSIFALFFVVFAVGGITLSFYNKINWFNWSNMVFTTFMCTAAVASISFFFSTVFAANRTGMIFLIGIPILFILLLYLSQIPSVESLKYFTPFGYPECMKLAHGQQNLWWLINLVYAAIAGVLFYLSIKIFDKKQLSI